MGFVTDETWKPEFTRQPNVSWFPGPNEVRGTKPGDRTKPGDNETRERNPERNPGTRNPGTDGTFPGFPAPTRCGTKRRSGGGLVGQTIAFCRQSTPGRLPCRGNPGENPENPGEPRGGTRGGETRGENPETRGKPGGKPGDRRIVSQFPGRNDVRDKAAAGHPISLVSEDWAKLENVPSVPGFRPLQSNAGSRSRGPPSAVHRECAGFHHG